MSKQANLGERGVRVPLRKAAFPPLPRKLRRELPAERKMAGGFELGGKSTYIVTRRDGVPVPSTAMFLILDLSSDELAPAVAKAYADRIKEKDPAFANEIYAMLTEVVRKRQSGGG